MLAYRLLTEEDSSAFCHKVTKALSEGWVLYGDPQYSFDTKKGILMCAQAVTKEVDVEYNSELKLGTL